MINGLADTASPHSATASLRSLTFHAVQTQQECDLYLQPLGRAFLNGAWLWSAHSSQSKSNSHAEKLGHHGYAN